MASALAKQFVNSRVVSQALIVPKFLQTTHMTFHHDLFAGKVPGLSSQSGGVTRCAVPLPLCGSVLLLSLPCLSSLYPSFLPGSWLEYWCSFLWIWLSPHLAESDGRRKYLGASETETSRLNRTKCGSSFYPWWKSMRPDRSQSDSTCQLQGDQPLYH